MKINRQIAAFMQTLLREGDNALVARALKTFLEPGIRGGRLVVDAFELLPRERQIAIRVELAEMEIAYRKKRRAERTPFQDKCDAEVAEEKRQAAKAAKQ